MSASVLIGDVLDMLRTLPDESVHCCVTSPPYWAIRDYGVDGQIGLESTPQEFVAKIAEVFREVHRVLRPDGTLWLNLGDSYNAAGRDGHGTRIGYKQATNRASSAGKDAVRPSCSRLKEKDLVGIPWRVAFALQDDGWYLRSDIIWAKPNPMPESVRDRPTKAHEYIFLLTKSPRYWYDADAIRSEAKSDPASWKMPDGFATHEGSHGSIHKDGREKGAKPDKQRGHPRPHEGALDAGSKAEQCAYGANARTVWEIATRPFKGAHFATFPPEIPRRCILAGCPEGGTVLDPFAGSGTTLAVAIALGRKAIGIELNPEYAKMIEDRLADVTPSLFLEKNK